MSYDQLVTLAGKAFGSPHRGEFDLELIMTIVPEYCDGCALELFGRNLPPEQAAIWSPFRKILKTAKPVALGIDSSPGEDAVPGGDISREETTILERLGVRSGIGMPLRLDGRLVGSFSVYMASSGRRFTPADFTGFCAVAEVIESSLTDEWLEGTQPIKLARGEDLSLLARKLSFGRLERYAAEQEVAERRKQQEAVAELAGHIITEPDLKAVSKEVVERVAEVLDIEYVKIAEFLPDENELVIRAVAGFSEKHVDRFRLPAQRESQAGFTMEIEETVRSFDFEHETRFHVPDIPGYHLKSGMSAVIGGAKRPWGVLEADSSKPRKYTDDEASFIKTMAGILGQAVERAASDRHRMELEERLRQAQKMEGMGRLAGGVAHDFNNLLTTIGGFTDLHLMEPDSQGPVREYALEIRKATERATRLTAQLLAFSRKQALLPQVFDPRQLIHDLSPLLRRLVGEHIDLVLRLDEQAGHILADPTQIEQVVMNLAVNARDAMPLGGTLTISVHSHHQEEVFSAEADIPEGRYTVLSVSDTGSGIPVEAQARIFDPFFTTKTPGKGTGLGLSTVYGIVQQSGGHVQMKSEPDEGSTFSVYLSEIRSTLAEDRRSTDRMEPTVPAEAATEGGEAGTILVAEDEESVRALLGRLLPRMGYRVIVASDGAEALQLARAHAEQIDLVLTDVVMPVMGGSELASALEREQPDLPILFMSGYADDMLAGQDILERGLPFLQKPFTIDKLIQGLEQAMEGRSERKEG